MKLNNNTYLLKYCHFAINDWSFFYYLTFLSMLISLVMFACSSYVLLGFINQLLDLSPGLGHTHFLWNTLVLASSSISCLKHFLPFFFHMALQSWSPMILFCFLRFTLLYPVSTGSILTYQLPFSVHFVC